MKRLTPIAILLCTLAMHSPADEATHWAKQAQNPFADLIKLPIETQFDFGYGHKDAVNWTTTIQPSMVSELSKEWNMVNRMQIPFKYQPGRTEGEKDSFGLGDITYEHLFTPSQWKQFDLGAGYALQIPTATDNQIGTRKWSAGLAAAANWQLDFLMAGTRANHLWSFAGKNNRDDVNLTTIEYWLYANLGNGWWVGTSPVNTANWEASSDQIWTIPVGGGIGKVVGNKLPLNLKLEAYSFTEIPDDLADWSVLLTIEYLVPENALFKR